MLVQSDLYLCHDNTIACVSLLEINSQYWMFIFGEYERVLADNVEQALRCVANRCAFMHMDYIATKP